MVKSRLLVEEKRMSRTESEDVTHEERALHTKKNQTQRRSAAGKPAEKWARKQDEEANRRSRKCFSCGEWGHISRNCKEARKRNPNSARIVI
ncbi:hypothetical protein AVEN_49005-1 [Araneus ventricosus]|uniref:CCHC-type domain-containing protein n=1 Tax=Araneus ventricosus TaxID=182803 RepID=A0A4Y2AGS0_ARAVE|nr:hypothetical protein AVEN_49005-1 [Araneus ventricosus]